MTALDNIKAALEAGPTEGPWFVAPDGQYKIATITKVTGIFADKMPTEAAIRADAALIAACNPSAIRELLAYVESLERDAARYRWLRDPSNANRDEWNSFGPYSSPQEIDAAIDAAMEQPK